MTKKNRKKKLIHNGKMVSAQRIWQVTQKRNGNCERCGKPSDGRALCDKCAEHDADKKGGRKQPRRPLKSAWGKVDWEKSDEVIAGQFGVTVKAVNYHRAKDRLAMEEWRLNDHYRGRWEKIGPIWMWTPWATIGMIECVEGRYRVTTFKRTGIFRGGVEKFASRTVWRTNLHGAKREFIKRTLAALEATSS